MYPPFSAIAYTPAVIASSPAAAMGIAATLAVLFYFCPLLAFCLSRPTACTLRGYVFFVLTLVTMMLLPLSAAATFIHVDAPALGFGLAACVALLAIDRFPRAAIPACTVLAWLSFWSKQVMLPLLLGLAIWVWVSHGRKSLFRYMGWATLTGLGLAWLIFAEFSFEWFVFNCIEIPKRVDWAGRFPSNLFLASLELLPFVIPMVVLAIACGVLSTENPYPLRTRLVENSSLLFFIVAMTLVPIAVMGRIKPW